MAPKEHCQKCKFQNAMQSKKVKALKDVLQMTKKLITKHW